MKKTALIFTAAILCLGLAGCNPATAFSYTTKKFKIDKDTSVICVVPNTANMTGISCDWDHKLENNHE